MNAPSLAGASLRRLVIASLVVAASLTRMSSADAAPDPLRDAYVAQMKPQMVAAITREGKALTAEEKAAVAEHWQDAMRALRIREVAAAEKDAVTVARVDALLARMDYKLLGRLAALNLKAPVTRR